MGNILASFELNTLETLFLLGFQGTLHRDLPRAYNKHPVERKVKLRIDVA
jgi:hypothetical protein